MKKKKLSNENLKISIRAQRFDGGMNVEHLRQ